jgi:signal transduction histidine kinase
VKPGDRVEIEGRSAPGLFAPIVDRPRVRLLAQGALPPARRLHADELVTGQEDGQWVEVEGLVRSFKLDRWGALLRLAAGDAGLSVAVSGVKDEGLAARFVNARLRVRGVPRAILTAWNQLASVVVQAPDLGALQVLTPPPAAPFSLPAHPVSGLLQFVPGQTWKDRVRVRGTVTYCRPGELYVQDQTGGVYVRSDRAFELQPGDVVDVVGFAASGDYKPMLQDAEVLVRGRAAPAAPQPVTPEEALAGRFDGGLISVEGRLLDIIRGPAESQLLMRAGPYLFSAVLGGHAPDTLRVGSGLRLSGICVVNATEFRVPQSFRILLRAAGDIEVRQAAPWWTVRRAAWVLAAMAAGIGLSLVWVTTLRRRVRVQSALLWERVKRETELQERQRMARELHDTLEQNLAGIGLSLEAAKRALPARTNVAEQHLALAIEQVGSGIDEVRRSVWALRNPSLDAGGLPAALDEIGRQLARCGPSPVTIRTRVLGERRPFSLAVENDLLRIGQEALTNAVRHGLASRIDVELRYDAETFRLRVADDGKGFDVRLPPRPGHFGLLGMRERAAAIGAHLEVRSAASRGTEVEVTIPAQPMRLRQVG